MLDKFREIFKIWMCVTASAPAVIASLIYPIVIVVALTRMSALAACTKVLLSCC